MDDWNLPWTGGCRCGKLRFEISAPPLITMACHCTGCQKMSASAYSLTIALPADGFEIVRGDPVRGGLRGEHGQYHCPACKAWLFTRPGGMDWLVNLRPSTLDRHDWYVPFIEVWTDEKLRWASTPARYSYATVPAERYWEAPMGDVSRSGIRPGTDAAPPA